MAQYSVGTVSTVANSQVVTGTGTAWLSFISGGDEMQIDPDASYLEILTVDSDTQITLAARVPDTRSAALYNINADFTATKDIPLMNQGDLHSADTFSRAMRIIDTALNGGMAWLGAVLDKDIATPPNPTGGPSDGDRYIIASVATGVWTGLEDDIATYSVSEAQWNFETPESGSFVLVIDENKLYIFDKTQGWLEWQLATTSTVVALESDEKLYFDGGTDTWMMHVSGSNTFQFGIDDAVVFTIGK